MSDKKITWEIAYRLIFDRGLTISGNGYSPEKYEDIELFTLAIKEAHCLKQLEAIHNIVKEKRKKND